MKEKSSLQGLELGVVGIGCYHILSQSHIVRFLNLLNFENKLTNQPIMHGNLVDLDKTFQTSLVNFGH